MPQDDESRLTPDREAPDASRVWVTPVLQERPVASFALNSSGTGGDGLGPASGCC